MPARPVTHFEDLFEVDAEARAPHRGAGRGAGAGMNWLCIFLGFCAADHPSRGRPLRRRQGDRDAGRALLPLLRAEDLVVQTRRDRVRGQSDPAGRLREDQRHEPRRGAPSGGRAPRLLRQADLEADRRDRRGAGGQHRPRLRDPLLRLPRRRAAGSRPSRSGNSGPGRRRQRSCSPATGSSPSTATRSPASTAKSASNGSASRSPPTNAPASRSMAAVAATPVTLLISRDGELSTISVRPEYDKANKRTLIGFSYGIHRTRSGRRRGRGRSRRHDLAGHGQEPARSSPTSSKPSSARKSPASSASAPSPTRRSTSASTRRCSCSPSSASRWA